MVRPLNYVAMAMIALLSAGDSYAAEEDTDCAAAYDGMLSCLSDGACCRTQRIICAPGQDKILADQSCRVKKPDRRLNRITLTESRHWEL